MAQCFVCAGDSSTEPLLTDLCDCRDLHLHASCQRRLIAQAPAHAHASDLPLLTLCPFVCLFYGIGAAFGCDFCALFLPLSSLAYCCLWIHAFGPAWRKVAIVGGDVGGNAGSVCEGREGQRGSRHGAQAIA
ncbi:hypothetical protein EMIHUDRAFT_234111 [Emiliania huxleyi CCMP1516]|uniref:RING-CH-type domain-containing protein n=2 Tax=Emiliania huxleyi TaxID=2903 RepID=A0A0D3K079_EMIH1|nr:hypothetical protein EMIHUDRAFT_234111 [Emiliania huxleyi CCMP1516]EOD29164.1 hypothetical protein EMIHUDRAFT_234111 [Emiliania huxleyi CCMP1516]|eukprot:XP_005781593.1 hypothetical protein EMIHUDRAFT_234111 [Emiliania huxleyi CCMP1516]